MGVKSTAFGVDSGSSDSPAAGLENTAYPCAILLEMKNIFAIFLWLSVCAEINNHSEFGLQTNLVSLFSLKN